MSIFEEYGAFKGRYIHHTHQRNKTLSCEYLFSFQRDITPAEKEFVYLVKGFLLQVEQMYPVK